MAASNMSSDEILKKITEVPGVDGGLQAQTFVKTENVDKLEIDLSVKCRGCFVEDPEMHYLFTIFDQQLSLADILMQASSYVCKEDDGFPPYLCTRCTTCLIDFFNFKIQYQKTDIYVRTLLGKNIPAALDPLSVKDELPGDSDGGSHAGDTVEDEPYYDDAVDESQFVDPPDINTLSDAASQHCTLCDVDFKTTEVYETHRAKEHGQNPFLKYRLFRKKVAENERALLAVKKKKRIREADRKMEILMNMPGKLCRFCMKKFPEEEFKFHWDSHKKHVCEQCGYKCIRKSDLDMHQKSVHTDVRNFSCKLCKKSFKTKPLLNRHQVVHLNPRAFCCDLCGQRFNDGGTLKTHVQLKHIRNRDFICPICGLAFPMKATLDKHILRHNKSRPPSFYCDICSSAFKDKSSLKRHNLLKHTEGYVKPTCEQCGKTYCSKTKLRFHIERHHGSIKVERKKRAPKKEVKVEEYLSSANSNSEESSDSFHEDHDSFHESRRRGPKVRNVSEDFYRQSPSYPSQRPNEEYFGYKKEEYESEEPSESSSETE